MSRSFLTGRLSRHERCTTLGVLVGETAMLAKTEKLYKYATVGESINGTEMARKAIADFYCERLEDLDIRHLWDRAGRRFFRVNFWGREAMTGGPTMRRSAFVAADFSDNSIRVCEVV
jgi:hypothetical protein